MPSPECAVPQAQPCGAFAAHAALLGGIARAAIESGAGVREPLRVETREYPGELCEKRAAFVTLRRAGSGELRGCMGAIEARLPLVVDVAQSAFNAAFRDPRFPRVRAEEIGGLDVFISILSALETLAVHSECELLSVLRREIDGVLLSEGAARAVFLPAVWKEIPDPHAFLNALRRKGGFAPDYWSPQLRVQRFTVDSVFSPASAV